MKKKQFKRFIAWGFTVLAVFLIASFSLPVRSYADSSTCTITFVMNRSVSSWKYEYRIYDASMSLIETVTSSTAFSRTDRPTLTLTIDNTQTIEIYAFQPGSSGIMYSNDFSVNLYDATLITSSDLTFTFNNSIGSPYFIANALKFNIAEPTPSPTPTPTPTPTPMSTPTQDPTITSDIQFWGRVNTNANGFWQVLTQIFNGIFNNVVMRNMIVYIPLFGLIITLVVYLFTFGGRHD